MSEPLRNWGTRAAHCTERALIKIRNNEDAIPDLTEAIAALRIEAGELPAEELEEYQHACICSAKQLDRGGFRGGCPVHGQVRNV